MGVDIVTVHDHLVVRDSLLSWRWYDAFGPAVVKHVEDGVSWPKDDASGDPTEWTLSITEAGDGDSTAVITDVAGGAILFTTAANEDDGWQMQLGQTAGENVSFAAGYPCYLMARFAINDVDQTDILVGVCVTDTDCLGAVTDGLYFRSVDGSATLYFVAEKDSVESAVVAATLADDTYITVEFYYDGTTVTAYVNGVAVGSVSNSSTSFPNNELLRLTFEFLTGETTANTCTLTDLKLIQIQA